jgi:Arc/MetJ family transcription regulator
MTKRTEITIDTDLLERAKRALREETDSAAVEVALRWAVQSIERERTDRAVRQRRFFEALETHCDPDVLASGEMWR